MSHRKTFHSISVGATILGIALSLPAVLQAQTPSPDSQGAAPQSDSQATPTDQRRAPSPEKQLKRLTKTLHLTSDQQQQILPILQNQDQQIESMRGDTSLAPQQRRQQMRSLMQDTRQKMEAVMTDSQKQQFEQDMQSNRDRMRDRRTQNGQMNGTAPSGDQPQPSSPDNQNPHF